MAIVGGGYTGLWTAYHLLLARPDLDVHVLEAKHVGFGASGRNGGWVSALYPVSEATLARRYGAAAARAMTEAMVRTVADVGEAVEREGIDCGFVRGGVDMVARGSGQAARARAGLAPGSPTEVRWMDREETLERVAVADTSRRRVEGATHSPHCARVHPRRLVDGLAAAVRARGGVIHEGTVVTDVRPTSSRSAAPPSTTPRATTPRSTQGGSAARSSLGGGSVIGIEHHPPVEARVVIRATEAWTATLPRLGRRVAPVYSLMIATEPLGSAQWERIGLEQRQTFSDHGHEVIYGQRTIDDQIAFGGRGAPYHLGSRIRPQFDRDERVFEALQHTLTELFPSLDGVPITHRWGGPLGIARDWHPSVGFDPGAGIGWAGGYVGDGVSTTHLAGATLADLVTGTSTWRTELPWVQHRSPSWELEPARWLGINAGLRLAALADSEEARTGRPARLGSALDRLTGH